MWFSRLELRDWRQFSDIRIDFHPRLTVIAGANGAGKSTLLRVLAQHFGYNNNLLSTPVMARNGALSYLSGLFKNHRQNVPVVKMEHIGSIIYTDKNHSELLVPQSGAAVYNVQIPHIKNVPGVFIGSHRPTSGYQALTSIPTNAVTAQQAYQTYNQEVQNKYNNSYSPYGPVYRIKEAIVSMATFGPGNANVQGNAELRKTYEEFKLLLHNILPSSMGFRDINIRIPDVVLITTSGEFMIDASSGGIMSLIDLAWQLFLFSRDQEKFVAVIDEPENHLHPSMQRTLLGSLLRAFPRAQFIVATHSPFVVSSVKNSTVYVLQYEEQVEGEANFIASRGVHSVKLANFSKAGTAGDILRNALGVPVTLPVWAERELEDIASKFTVESLNETTISQLRLQLDHAGLSEFYPEALSRIASQE